MLFYITQES